MGARGSWSERCAVYRHIVGLCPLTQQWVEFFIAKGVDRTEECELKGKERWMPHQINSSEHTPMMTAVPLDVTACSLKRSMGACRAGADTCTCRFTSTDTSGHHATASAQRWCVRY